jgi:hypothetical protein
MIDDQPLPHGTKVLVRLRRYVFAMQGDDFFVTSRAAIITGAVPFILPIEQAIRAAVIIEVSGYRVFSPCLADMNTGLGHEGSPKEFGRNPIRQDGCFGRIIEADKTKNSLSSPLDFV